MRNPMVLPRLAAVLPAAFWSEGQVARRPQWSSSGAGLVVAGAAGLGRGRLGTLGLGPRDSGRANFVQKLERGMATSGSHLYILLTDAL